MGERDQHPVGTSAGGRDECCTLANTEREMVNMGVAGVSRRNAAVAQDVQVHEQTIKETINPTLTDRPILHAHQRAS